MEDKKHFFSCLFDFSFSELVTLKVIKVLYCIGIAIAGLAALWLVLGAFGQSFAKGLLYVISAPVVFMLLVVVLRIKLEILMTVFRIEENTRKVQGPVEGTVVEAEVSEEPLEG